MSCDWTVRGFVFASRKQFVGRRLGLFETSFDSHGSYRERTLRVLASLSTSSNKNKPLWDFFLLLVDQEVSILHNKSLEDRLRNVIQEVNEEINYWYFLLELRYHQHLDRLNE